MTQIAAASCQKSAAPDNLKRGSRHLPAPSTLAIQTANSPFPQPSPAQPVRNARTSAQDARQSCLSAQGQAQANPPRAPCAITGSPRATARSRHWHHGPTLPLRWQDHATGITGRRSPSGGKTMPLASWADAPSPARWQDHASGITNRRSGSCHSSGGIEGAQRREYIAAQGRRARSEVLKIGAGEGNRTLVFSLGSRSRPCEINRLRPSSRFPSGLNP